MTLARAFWTVAPGQGEIRTETLPAAPPPDHLRLRALATGISRGTESLVFAGRVPPSQYATMGAPLMEGAFPFPVKYGYSAVGRVEAGPPALQGRTVFCLHPHQDVFIAPAACLMPVPNSVPPRRAVLAANLETALNAHWDAGSGPADRIVVVNSGTPLRATNTRSGALSQISSIRGSSKYRCSGPNPATASRIDRTASSALAKAGRPLTRERSS